MDVAKLAHDLRGPLHVVMGYADLLASQRAGPLNQKQLEFVAKLQAGLKAIAELISLERGPTGPSFGER